MLDLEVAQGQIGVDLIAIASADPGAVHIAGVDQVGHDPLHGSIGDPRSVGDVGDTDRRVFGEA